MAYVKKSLRTKRTLVDNYKGYPIFLEVNTYFKHSFFNPKYYDTNHVSSKTENYYCCIKNGDMTKSSDRYAYCCRSIEEVKNLISRIENGEEIVLTDKERHDWVIAPNSKNGWGFNTEMLMAIMRAYKKASKRRRVGYLERLEDANFHSEYSALEEENYEEFERLAKSL